MLNYKIIIIKQNPTLQKCAYKIVNTYFGTKLPSALKS